MALAPRLDLRQSQQLVMTPQLQQAIKLLQLSNIELQEFVLQEIESNPLLDEGQRDDEGPVSDSERDEKGSGDGTEERSSDGDPDDDGLGDIPLAEGADTRLESGEDFSETSEAPLDTNLSDDVYHHDSTADTPADYGREQLGLNGLGEIRGGGGFADDSELEGRVTGAQTLRDHLTEQLKLVALDPAALLIASYLIDVVDDAGYLTESVPEIAERLGTTEQEVGAVLDVCQGMEPAGLFARDLKECLAIQLRERDRLDPCMQALLDNLDVVARQDLASLRRLCHVDAEDIHDMVHEIRALNPKPGLAIGDGDPIQPVVPDVFVRRTPEGIWTVELNSETLPKVLVNSQYYAELNSLAGDKKDKAYLSECLSNANWLVRALDQRARTILKVASELIRQQTAFFESGVQGLKPLNLKAIAEAIEMHESTVSRVTANKYLASERGVFEMKYFFTSAIASSDGDVAHSAEAVRHRIRDLIDAESPSQILSDDKIVEMLNDKGIDIARRTVAKYREAMRIPSSVQRRRQKNMKL